MSPNQACDKLAILYIALLSVPGVLSDIFNTCTRYTSFGYGYRDFFEFELSNLSLNHVFYLEFYVKTSSDAHVLLKSTAGEDDGYEIVIGGGSNTFSQIRQISQNERTTMITQKTENFLSSIDYRQFWISIDKLGIISVGKKEDDEVFINWRFDNLLPVRSFSFGSWTNIKADWRFACRNTSDPVREMGAASPLLRLKHDLFTLYDPNALPAPEYQTMTVSVGFEISHVDLDEQKGALTLHGAGILKWTDSKIKWKPENYNGTDRIYVPPFIIWTPSITILNTPAMDKVPLFDLTAAGVMVKHDGSVFWRPPLKSVSSCLVDIQNWPYDEHNCTIAFGLWMEPPNLEMSLMMNEIENLPKSKGKWDVTGILFYNTNWPDNEENIGVIHLNFKRMDGTNATAFTVSYIGAVAMSLFSFWLSVNNSLRLHLRCGSLLLLIVTLFFLGATIPIIGQKIPHMINLYSWTAVLSSIPILLHVVLINIQQRLEVPQWCAKILSHGVLNWMFCLPELPQSCMEYSNLNDGVNKLHNNRLMCLRLITIIERFFFLGFLLGLFLIQILI